MRVHLAYGERGLDVELPESTLVLQPEPVEPLPEPQRAVGDAIERPLGAPPLRDLVRSEDPSQLLSLLGTLNGNLKIMGAEGICSLPQQHFTGLNIGARVANLPDHICGRFYHLHDLGLHAIEQLMSRV